MARKTKAEMEAELKAAKAKIEEQLDHIEDVVEDIVDGEDGESAPADAVATEAPVEPVAEAAPAEAPVEAAAPVEPVAEVGPVETPAEAAAPVEPVEPVAPEVPAAVEVSAETVAVALAGEQPPAVEQPSTVAEAMENAAGVEAAEKDAEAAPPAPLTFGQFLEALAVEADAHPQGMQGLIAFDPPRPLPEGVSVQDSEYQVQGARWEWIVESNAVTRGTRDDMVHFVSGVAAEVPKEDAA
jgi:hypothetical protein